MKNHKLLIYLICVLIPEVSIWGQANYNAIFNPVSTPPGGSSRDFVPPSPEAASLGIFGQIPVGNFTGVASVNIPICELRYKELSVPVSISYHASGNKPDILPGSVGMGWALQAGGCITRIVRGVPDYLLLPNDFAGLCQESATPRKGEDWASDETLRKYLLNPFYTPENTNDPDEFYFNINGQTGKFILDHQDTLRIRSAQGDAFKVIKHMTRVIGAQSSLVGFTMIDTNGIEYAFCEEKRRQFFDRTIQSVIRSEQKDHASGNTMWIPMAWHLTSIRSPNDYSIVFNYGPNFSATTTRFSDYLIYRLNGKFNISYSNYYLDDSRQLGYSNWCVSSIECLAGVIKFDFDQAIDQLRDTAYNSCLPLKLNRVRLFNDLNGDHCIKTCEFDYTNSESTRLKLLSLKFSGENTEDQAYRFDYNPTCLPGYNSWETDFYGFYNGGPAMFAGTDKFSWTEKLRNDPGYFDRIKKPVFEYTTAEILEYVHYPTGGYTHFIYEPNDYGSSFHTWPFEVRNNPEGNEQTGGVRIKRIDNFEKEGKLLNRKTYHYVKDYLEGGTRSSGVLVYKPTFIERYENKRFNHGNITDRLDSLFRWSTNPIFPMAATRGNHVTYSEVTVEEAGSGYTVNKYKNFDNGYLDKELINYTSTPIYDAITGNTVDFHQQEEGISMDLERGQLMSEEFYDATKILKKRITYTYNNDPKRFDQNARFLRLVPHVLNSIKNVYSYRIAAGVIYTYFPYLKEKKEVTYLNDSIVQETAYTYIEPFRLPKTKAVTNSGPGKITKTYTYAFEKAANNPTYQAMANRYMMAYPVEESLKNGTFPIKTIKRTFEKGLSFAPEFILLKSEEEQIAYGVSEKIREIQKYDYRGNPLGIVTNDGREVSILWSYIGQYPVLYIEGAGYSEISKLLTEKDIDIFTEIENPTTKEIEFIFGKLNTSLPQARITVNRYKPLVGKVYERDPNGLETHYHYDDSGRLNYITDPDGNKTMIYEYHYQN